MKEKARIYEFAPWVELAQNMTYREQEIFKAGFEAANAVHARKERTNHAPGSAQREVYDSDMQNALSLSRVHATNAGILDLENIA